MTRGNRRRSVAAVLVASLLTAGLAAILATSAWARGVTHEQLEAHGWTCFVPPPSPNLVECLPPGLGRPFPGNPDPPPSYSFLMFDRASGEFLFTGHLIRADLYRGQPCGSGGEAYGFLAPIGYYVCTHH
jgi:hypothetical protein